MQDMTTENAVRLLAGSFALISLVLARWVSPYWLWLAVFVAVNLIQSAFTRFCPAEMVFQKFGIGRSGGKCCS